MKNKIEFSPIGTIHTPFDGKEKIPRQGRFGENNDGVAEIFPEFTEGLNGLESFSHIYLLFHFHQSGGYMLTQVTPRHHQVKGVFAIRSPRRPNGIGMTIVKLQKIEGNKIYFSGADMINGTPLLDIKPYSTGIDCYPEARNGWLETLPKGK
jgi:tRNA-Thr(GGU) m(6)t(6)A37 methyltransferase TsaA